MEVLKDFWGMIRNNFFYDLRSSIISICVIIGVFYLYLLLKDNYDKLGKTLKNLVCVAMCVIIVAVLL